MNFSAQARWIWQAGETAPRNFWLRLRRPFTCPQELKRATLLITADSRYELFVNGEDVGNGPVRAFPWSYSYDEYDVTSWLHRGENVLAVRALHWGDHSFQYILGRAGFLCELVLEHNDGSEERISSDEQWLLSPEMVFERNTPRISIQQGFEEQYDARREEPWQQLDYTATDWEHASIIGPLGTAPWLELSPRTIPFLERDVVLPTKVLAAELAILPQGYRWSFDMRRQVADLTIGLRAEAIGTRGNAFATEIIVEQDCTIRLLNAHGTDYSGWHTTCNGVIVRGEELQLKAGRNLFVITTIWWPSFYFQTPEQLIFDATHIVSGSEQVAGGTWAYLGPFDERDQTTQRIQQAASPDQLPETPRLLITSSDNLEDIFLLTKSQRFLLPPGGFCDPTIAIPQPREQVGSPTAPLIEQRAHLFHENADYTLLTAHKEGDTHLIIDFGRELCGFPVLALDAPAGTIVDANFFEGIDESGIFWTEGLRNSFRYICREGYQTFRSHQRRGFRYASLTFRNPTNTPIKLYNVRCLQNTYAVEERGSFVSSDALLNEIWNVAAYTVLLCMEDTYVDCPAYEQTFWVGDARNSALVNAVAFGAYELTARCIRLVAQSLSHQDAMKPPHKRKRTHLTTDHTVSGWFSEIPMWTFLWMWNVWEHYQLTGEQETLKELYPAVRECLQRCLSFLTPRGLMNIPDVWNLVDWSAMDLTSDGEVTSSNALLVESLRRAAIMAEELARLEPAQSTILQTEIQQYREAADRIYQAINSYCWSEERGAYVDTVRDQQGYEYHVALTTEYGLQTDERNRFIERTRISEHTNTLILLCNCAPPERAERIFPLVEAAREGNFVGSIPQAAEGHSQEEIVPVGSPWFLFFTLETLLARGEIETAVTIIRDQWGRMLEKGATTFWETFPNLRAVHWSRSLCHGWSAAPAYFLSTLILGVQPAEPGYRHVRIAPHSSGLHWARGSVPTPHGDVAVRWTVQENQWTIDVTLPTGVTGELALDDSNGEPQFVSGAEGETTNSEQGWRVILPQGATARYLIPLQPAQQ